jgi:ATP-dependent RNA helicase RhlB
MTANDEKIPFLISLLRRAETSRTLVFINTKRMGERIWGFLESNGIAAGLLTGSVPQKQRLRLLREFQDGTLPVLVATDVAARGLHIPEVSHVVNFDLPDDPEDYVHRIGRTARAGATGEAINLVCETYALCLPDIEAFIGQHIDIGKVEDGDLAVDLKPPVRIADVKQRPRQASKAKSAVKQTSKKRSSKTRNSSKKLAIANAETTVGTLPEPTSTENALAITHSKKRRYRPAKKDQEPHNQTPSSPTRDGGHEHF